MSAIPCPSAPVISTEFAFATLDAAAASAVRPLPRGLVFLDGELRVSEPDEADLVS